MKRPAPKPRPKKKSMAISDHALMLAGQRPPGPPRVKLGPPALPPGVRPKGQKMAMDDGGMNTPWGWSNNMQGIGCGLFFPGYPYLAELSQRPEYRSPIEAIAEEMTRQWIKFVYTADATGNKKVSDKLAKMTQAFKDFGIQDKFRRATELDGQFGMAKLFVRIDKDDDDRDSPLIIDPKTIPKGSIKGFKVIEPMWVTPQMWNATDPTADDFYKPEMWFVLGRPTHATRLLNFVSREVPDLLKPSYNFGGISLAQMLEQYVNQWLRTKNSIADLIHNFSIISLATDMQALLDADPSGASFYKRIEMFIKNRDNKGLMALNKDTEELNQLAVPLGTLDALQAQAQEHMSAISRLPLVKAFGITPKGLNASSDGEILVFDDHVHARQEIQYTANLQMISQMMQCHLFGEIDPAIGIDYVPMRELDGEALSRVRKADAELAATNVSAGITSPEEERQRLADNPDSGYSNLQVEDVPEPPSEPGDEENTDKGGSADDE